jgi:hypothetical protein
MATPLGEPIQVKKEVASMGNCLTGGSRANKFRGALGIDIHPLTSLIVTLSGFFVKWALKLHQSTSSR